MRCLNSDLSSMHTRVTGPAIVNVAERAAEMVYGARAISVRDLVRIVKGPRAFNERSAIDAALRVLVARGYLRTPASHSHAMTPFVAPTSLTAMEDRRP